MLSSELVQKIASLARLKLSDEETESLTVQLDSILEYIQQLNELDTSKVEPTSFMAPAHDPLRDDANSESLTQEQILQNGPSVKKCHFAIPKVIGG
ncbi:MAG: Asp-tRNA(Asn)/Glu-tRNA(Gln) amidotransferase subunit GatC [Fibrobacter sp.]|jgi:aspartyl-tRNA(Asn)/glutamyl-tRNA(Gln) amidotransferase subunit C|nr:Asp-tRNA(Asn)/Glu-tRNA(Gln) amidotransferase subunit GatC [Fibrobacter sp.]